MKSVTAEASSQVRYNKSTVVVLYGVSGCGKTCFLASILWHLRQKGMDLGLNVKGNPQGVELYNELVQYVSRGQVPLRTPLGTGFELDLRIKEGDSERVLTVVDIAGETSSLLTKHASERGGGDTGGTLDASIKTEVGTVLGKYLTIQTADVVILCFIDIFNEKHEVSDQELGAENLLMHIKQRFDHVVRVGIVLTKIDKFSRLGGGSGEPMMSYNEMVKKARSYSKENSLFYRMYRNPQNTFGDRIRILPFAIGRVQEKEGLIVEHFDGGFDSFARFVGLGEDVGRTGWRSMLLFVGLFLFVLLIVVLATKNGLSLTDFFVAFAVSALGGLCANQIRPSL